MKVVSTLIDNAISTSSLKIPTTLQSIPTATTTTTATITRVPSTTPDGGSGTGTQPPGTVNLFGTTVTFQDLFIGGAGCLAGLIVLILLGLLCSAQRRKWLQKRREEDRIAREKFEGKQGNLGTFMIDDQVYTTNDLIAYQKGESARLGGKPNMRFRPSGQPPSPASPLNGGQVAGMAQQRPPNMMKQQGNPSAPAFAAQQQQMALQPTLSRDPGNMMNNQNLMQMDAQQQQMYQQQQQQQHQQYLQQQMMQQGLMQQQALERQMLERQQYLQQQQFQQQQQRLMQQQQPTDEESMEQPRLQPSLQDPSGVGASNATASLARQLTQLPQLMPQGMASQLVPQGMAPQLFPQGMAPQLMPQGMAPQLMPQGVTPQLFPQGMAPQLMPQAITPQLFPQGMAPQLIPQGMAPQLFPQDMGPQLIPQGMVPQLIHQGMAPQGMPRNPSRTLKRASSMFPNGARGSAMDPSIPQSMPSAGNMESILSTANNVSVPQAAALSMSRSPTAGSPNLQGLAHATNGVVSHATVPLPFSGIPQPMNTVGAQRYSPDVQGYSPEQVGLDRVTPPQIHSGVRPVLNGTPGTVPRNYSNRQSVMSQRPTSVIISQNLQGDQRRPSSTQNGWEGDLGFDSEQIPESKQPRPPPASMYGGNVHGRIMRSSTSRTMDPANFSPVMFPHGSEGPRNRASLQQPPTSNFPLEGTMISEAYEQKPAALTGNNLDQRWDSIERQINGISFGDLSTNDPASGMVISELDNGEPLSVRRSSPLASRPVSVAQHDVAGEGTLIDEVPLQREHDQMPEFDQPTQGMESRPTTVAQPDVAGEGTLIEEVPLQREHDQIPESEQPQQGMESRPTTVAQPTVAGQGTLIEEVPPQQRYQQMPEFKQSQHEMESRPAYVAQPYVAGEGTLIEEAPQQHQYQQMPGFELSQQENIAQQEMRGFEQSQQNMESRPVYVAQPYAAGEGTLIEDVPLQREPQQRPEFEKSQQGNIMQQNNIAQKEPPRQPSSFQPQYGQESFTQGAGGHTSFVADEPQAQPTQTLEGNSHVQQEHQKNEILASSEPSDPAQLAQAMAVEYLSPPVILDASADLESRGNEGVSVTEGLPYSDKIPGTERE